MYGEDNFLYENPLNRYNITDRSNCVKNPDGSLDIYIQHNQYDAAIDNWLPAPAGKFHLYFRIYNPVERVANNQWTMPVITRL